MTICKEKVAGQGGMTENSSSGMNMITEKARSGLRCCANWTANMPGYDA